MFHYREWADRRLTPDRSKNALTRHLGRRAGMTLVEAAISLAVLSMVCGGVFSVGLHVRRLAEQSRVATEARSLAKERLEEMAAMGHVSLALPGCLLGNTDTNLSSLGAAIIRRPRIVWHMGDGSVGGASTSVYAEVHMDMIFRTPAALESVTNTYSLIIQ